MAVRVGGRMIVAQHNVVDSLKVLSHQAWRLEAACLGMDPNEFALPDKFDDDDKKIIQEAVKVCENCPVITECGDSASTEDKKFSIRGGNLPTEMGALRGRPVGMLKRGICLKNLHPIKSKDDLKAGRCKECEKIRQHERYLAKMKCPNGHAYLEVGFVWEVNSRDGNEYKSCNACRAAAKERKNINRKKVYHAAKLETRAKVRNRVG